MLEITGDTVRKYIRGITLAACVTGNAPVYYQYDGHGSVVQLTDATGAVIKNYDYDAFGNELVWNYGDANPFRYSGEYFDADTELYYLRARYYWPSLGQFTQEDTHWNPGNMVYGDSPTALPRGLVNSSSECYLPSPMAMMQSGNLYVYCAGNPIMYIDPDGELGIFATIAINTGISALVSGGAQIIGNFISGEQWNNGLVTALLSGAASGLITGPAAFSRIAGGGVTILLGGMAGLAQGVITGDVTTGEDAILAFAFGATTGLFSDAVVGKTVGKEVERMIQSKFQTLSKAQQKAILNEVGKVSNRDLQAIRTSLGKGGRSDLLNQWIEKYGFSFVAEAFASAVFGELVP